MWIKESEWEKILTRSDITSQTRHVAVIGNDTGCENVLDWLNRSFGVNVKSDEPIVERRVDSDDRGEYVDKRNIRNIVVPLFYANQQSCWSSKKVECSTKHFQVNIAGNWYCDLCNAW